MPFLQRTKGFSLLLMLLMCTSCVTPIKSTPTFNTQLQAAIDHERSISAMCLGDRKKWGDARYWMDEQEGNIVMRKWVGTLIKAMDSETHGSVEQQSTILFNAIRINGDLFILEELDRYYRLSSKAEFYEAAKQSGKASSDLCRRDTPGTKW